MTLNKALLARTLAHIEANPETFNGQFWRSGTTMDFAGHAAIQAGAEWLSTVDDDTSIRLPQCGDSQSVAVFRSSVVRTPAPESRLMHVADFAAQALGIDDITEDALFDDVSVADLAAMIHDLLDYGVATDPTPVTQEEVTAP